MAKDIRVTLEIDNQQYIAELKRSEQATQAFAKNSEAGTKNVQQSLKGLDSSAKQLTQSMNRLKAVLGIAAFTAFAASAIQMGDAISDMAKATGFSIAQLQNLRSALATNGGEAENAGNLLAQFGQKVDDLAQGKRPAAMKEDEAIVYQFCKELHDTKAVSDATYQATVDKFGESGVVDLMGITGYYTMLAMVLNVARQPLANGVAPPLPTL